MGRATVPAPVRCWHATVFLNGRELGRAPRKAAGVSGAELIREGVRGKLPYQVAVRKLRGYQAGGVVGALTIFDAICRDTTAVPGWARRAPRLSRPGTCFHPRPES